MQIQRFYAFMRARESIRQRKEEGLPWPWTQDNVLQRYRFPNVKRQHDKTTRVFIDEFYKPNQYADFPTILYNALMARSFGTTQWVRLVGWQSNYEPDFLLEGARVAEKNNVSIFTNAYMLGSGPKNQRKHEFTILDKLYSFWNNSVLLGRRIFEHQSWEVVAKDMHEMKGFSNKNFMVREVLLDTFYCNVWRGGRPKDYKTWFPVTKAAREGMKLLGLQNKHTFSQSLDCLKLIHSKRFDYWPKEYPDLELEDIDRQLACYVTYTKGGKTTRRYKVNENH